jgi:uncharacterized OB-fold protein
MNSLVRNAESDQAQFVAHRCDQCSLLVFPPRRRCARCLSTSFHEELVKPEGELYSFTVVHMGRPDIPVPFAIGVADFPEDIRVMARVEGWQAGIEIGQAIRAADAPAEEQIDDDRGNIRLALVPRTES